MIVLITLMSLSNQCFVDAWESCEFLFLGPSSEGIAEASHPLRGYFMKSDFSSGDGLFLSFIIFLEDLIL